MDCVASGSAIQAVRVPMSRLAWTVKKLKYNSLNSEEASLLPFGFRITYLHCASGFRGYSLPIIPEFGD